MSNSRRRALALIAGLATGATASVSAQTFPDRPITIMVPYVAGTIADLFTRTMANELSGILKQPVVIDNRPGAGQVVAANLLTRAAPNGYTLMTTVTPNVVAPSIMKGQPYSGIGDFAAVAPLAGVVGLLTVSPKVPANNLKEFIALLKANPGKYSFGSSGVGSALHLFSEMFLRDTGTQALHVPYKTFQNIITDITTGQVDFGFMTFSTMQFVQAGKMKAFGTPGLQRDPAHPDMPTLDEQGVKGFDATINYGIVAPKGTPAAVLERLNAAIAQATAAESFLAKTRPLGGVRSIRRMTPAETQEWLVRDEERYARLVRDQNIALE